MTSLTGEEPDLQLGDSGEWVVQLQVRLYGLRLLREVPDQSFGSTTEQAVRELQNQVGHSATGEVNRDTWEALVYAENQANIQYRYTSPYDALDQIVYDLQHGVQRDGSGNVIQEGSSEYAGQLSDDGQYRWDGYHWQPVARRATGRVRVAGAAVRGRPVPLGRDRLARRVRRCRAAAAVTVTPGSCPRTGSTAGTGAPGKPSAVAVATDRTTSDSCPTTGDGAGTATSGRRPDAPSASDPADGQVA